METPLVNLPFEVWRIEDVWPIRIIAIGAGEFALAPIPMGQITARLQPIRSNAFVGQITALATELHSCWTT